jgi:hypothetical protein
MIIGPRSDDFVWPQGPKVVFMGPSGPNQLVIVKSGVVLGTSLVHGATKMEPLVRSGLESLDPYKDMRSQPQSGGRSRLSCEVDWIGETHGSS